VLQSYLEMTGDTQGSNQRSPDGLASQMLGEDFEHLSEVKGGQAEPQPEQEQLHMPRMSICTCWPKSNKAQDS